MKDFYFTFGASHYTVEGKPMGFEWIRVKANSSNKARRLIMDWCDEFMGDPNKFAFQYEENNFEPDYFPGGEYLLITDE